MALSNAQKIQILTYVGWPAQTIVSGSLSFSNITAGRLNNLDPDAEAMVVSLLNQITANEGKLVGSLGNAGVKAIDDIEFFGVGDGISSYDSYHNENRRLIKRLALILDIGMGPGYDAGCGFSVVNTVV